MTNQEAIEKFEKIKRGNIFLIHQRIEGKEVFDDYSLCDMAISALEKQIPQKPKMPLDAFWVCPVCGKKVEHPYEHCKRCGQAIDCTIDWEENEE